MDILFIFFTVLILFYLTIDTLNFTITLYSYGCEFMKKIYRVFIFECKMAFKNFFRHFALSLSAIMSVSITLILISIFLLITTNIRNFTYHVEDQIVIRATIDTILNEKQKQQLQEQITAMKNISHVEFYTGAQELEAYKKEYEKEVNVFHMYEGDTNPIKDSFLIEVKDHTAITQTSDAIQQLEGIVDVTYGGDHTNTMIEILEVIQKGSFLFLSLLLCIAILLIANKIKMSIYTRKAEIAIMRFVGASNWCIKFPMLIEGMWIGLFGSCIPICITIFGYNYLYTLLDGVLFSNMFQLLPTFPLLIQVILLLVFIGVMVGIIGNYFSVSKYLKWKR